MSIHLRVRSGHEVDLEHLLPEQIHLTDVACALSKVCRFAGHIPQHYSVAQHAALVASLVPRPLALHALHHDDSEAFLGDVSRNLKHSEFMKGYRALERRIEGAIATRFKLRFLTHTEIRTIKTADDLAVVFERVTLVEQNTFRAERDISWAIGMQYVGSSSADLRSLVDRLPQSFPHQLPEEAEGAYLQLHQTYSFCA